MMDCLYVKVSSAQSGLAMGILMHNHLVFHDQVFHFYQGPVLFLKSHIILKQMACPWFLTSEA